jgi:DNA-binding CsgD family transcriptional regulator
VKNDPIAILEAAYDLTGSEQEWIRRVVEAAWSSLEDGHGLMGWTYDVNSCDSVDVRAKTTFRTKVDILGSSLEFNQALPPAVSRTVVQVYRTGFVGTMTQAPDALRVAGLGNAIADAFKGSLADFCRRCSFADALWVNAQDPTRIGFLLVAPRSGRLRPVPREVHKWQCVAAHLSAAFRVRRHVDRWPSEAKRAPVSPEAVLRPDGKLEHAEEPAKALPARESLRRAVLAFDRARGELRRRDPEEAVAIWRALVAGRWSLVDHFDSDGRRFVVAHRNDATPPDARGLTLRERQAIAYAAIGHSNKQIAYELGLSASTVAGYLSRARAKLQLQSLAALRAPSG